MFQTVMFCPSCYLTNGNFTPNFNPFECLNKISNKKEPFLKENRGALYLSYATLLTYVSILGAEQFQFLCNVFFFYGFFSNWFKLVPAHPWNSQTLNQKKNCCYHLQDFFIEFFFFLWCDNGYRAEGHTEITISVKQSW